MPTLSREEREQFLAEPHVAALSVDGGAGRAPLTVPIWYQYTPGGEAWIATGADSRKALRIAEAGRFTLMVDRVAPTVRYVSVEGPVTATLALTDEWHGELARRYMPEDAVPSYMEMIRRVEGEQVLIRMRPQRWLSADLGVT